MATPIYREEIWNWVCFGPGNSDHSWLHLCYPPDKVRKIGNHKKDSYSILHICYIPDSLISRDSRKMHSYWIILNKILYRIASTHKVIKLARRHSCNYKRYILQFQDPIFRIFHDLEDSLCDFHLSFHDVLKTSEDIWTGSG